MTGYSYSDRDPEFWVTPNFPRGYCPIHTWKETPCSECCSDVRAAFGQVARDTEAYFSSLWYLRQRETAERAAA